MNVLAPGVVLTERVAAFIKPDNPIYRKSLLGPSDPRDVAAMNLYLASDEARKVTGTVMRVDGGASIYCMAKRGADTSSLDWSIP
ncbi:MAG: SDR family oxidoreductase [Gemmatimonadetes bacterium]|nr:SDR family oxidoreductase [Gemmatimonadota bacterium]